MRGLPAGRDPTPPTSSAPPGAVDHRAGRGAAATATPEHERQHRDAAHGDSGPAPRGQSDPEGRGGRSGDLRLHTLGRCVFGGEVILINAMLGKTWTTKFGPFRTQLNVDNLLANDDLIITDKDNTGTYRFLFQQPRRWSVTVTRAF